MTRTDKLYSWILANPRSAIPFRDFERLLAAFGFSLGRTTGSHRQYAHPKVPHVLTVQPRGEDAKAMCIEYDLALDE